MNRISVLVLCDLLFQVNSARILAVFPMPSISHQVIFRPITQELARRGHEVVVITPDPAFQKRQAPKNLIEIDVHEQSYRKWNETLLKAMMQEDAISQIKVMFAGGVKVFEVQINMKEVKDIIEKKFGEFDMLLTEACVAPALGFSHVFQVPLVQISSFGAVSFNDEYIGAYTNPLLFPIAWYHKTYNLTSWEKIIKLWKHWDFKMYVHHYNEEEEHQILKKVFGEDIPDLKSLKNNIDLLLLNMYPVWVDNQPVPPSVVYMGGIHQIPRNDLPQDLQSYLDQSKNGAIYFSFGTNAIPSALPQHIVHGILRVLSQMPYNVLLKWDTEELPISSKNIMVRKWFPQSDVLRHPNIKAFITQGGLQSTDEAIAAGVPMVGVPILGDQWYNVDKYVKHKIGTRIHLESFNEEDFRRAIETVITDKSYRENLIKFRALIQDQPQPPLERAVWWIEHVLRHGGAHLRPPTANISTWDWLEGDLILLVLSLIISAVTVIAVALYTICKCLSTKKLEIKQKHS